MRITLTHNNLKQGEILATIFNNPEFHYIPKYTMMVMVVMMVVMLVMMVFLVMMLKKVM